MLEAEEAKDDTEVAPENPNPYEKRALEIAELKRQIQLQTNKKGKAEGRIVYIQQQLDAEEKLVEAMASDEQLALEEAQISSNQNALRGSDPLSLAWSGIATSALATRPPKYLPKPTTTKNEPGPGKSARTHRV